jgi:hypothetical protein
VRPLPRFYLLLAVGVLGLGLYVLTRQIVHPLPDATIGCVSADFAESGGSPKPAWAQVHLRACPHFDESYVDVWVDAPIHDPHQGGWVLDGTIPGDPRRWPEFMRVRWLSAETLRVEHSPAMRFRSRSDTAGEIRVLFVTVGADSF